MRRRFENIAAAKVIIFVEMENATCAIFRVILIVLAAAFRATAPYPIRIRFITSLSVCAVSSVAGSSLMKIYLVDTETGKKRYPVNRTRANWNE